MNNGKRFEFDREQAYKLVAVLDKDGNDKTNSKDLYSNAKGCIAVNLRHDEDFIYDGMWRIYLDFVQDEDGSWINRGIHTSPVYEVRTTEAGIEIHTHYSVYVFEKAKLKDTPICSNQNTIELYLSLDEKYNFAKGFYWDNNGESHELEADIHEGTFVDTVLIGYPEENLWGNYVCRYYLNNRNVEFYDTLYHQQEYNTPMLIHNTSKNKKLTICFEGYDKQWTVLPGDSKEIIPFNPINADKEE